MRWWNRENYSQRRSLQIRQHAGYHTGARKNELRRIQWPQVDFDGNVIRLPASQTKTKKACTLPIYGDMRRWLEHQRATCPADCPRDRKRTRLNSSHLGSTYADFCLKKNTVLCDSDSFFVHVCYCGRYCCSVAGG